MFSSRTKLGFSQSPVLRELSVRAFARAFDYSPCGAEITAPFNHFPIYLQLLVSKHNTKTALRKHLKFRPETKLSQTFSPRELVWFTFLLQPLGDRTDIVPSVGTKRLPTIVCSQINSLVTDIYRATKRTTDLSAFPSSACLSLVFVAYSRHNSYAPMKYNYSQ